MNTRSIVGEALTFDALKIRAKRSAAVRVGLIFVGPLLVTTRHLSKKIGKAVVI